MKTKHKKRASVTTTGAFFFREIYNLYYEGMNGFRKESSSQETDNRYDNT